MLSWKRHFLFTVLLHPNVSVGAGDNHPVQGRRAIANLSSSRHEALGIVTTHYTTIHDRQTRYRDSLNIPFSRINAGQRAFYYRGIKVWNNLSKDEGF